jgi:hypothetical protein
MAHVSVSVNRRPLAALLMIVAVFALAATAMSLWDTITPPF